MQNSITSLNKRSKTKARACSLAVFSTSVLAMFLAPAAPSLLDGNSGFIPVAYAAEEDEGRRPPPPTRTSETLTRQVYERIEEVMAFRDMEQYAEAREILDELKELNGRGRLNDYEQYTMWLFYASLDQAQENYEGAIANYEQLLMVPNLKPEQIEQAWMMVGSLYFATENFPEAIEAFNTYNEIAVEPNADVYLRLATAYYQTEQYETALDPLLRNMELVRAKGQAIPQSTYGLLRALYLTLEDYENARQVLREMIVLYDEADDWNYLAQIEGQLENFMTQAHTYYVANAAAKLETESQLINLASQLFNNDNPYGCGRVIQMGIDEGIIEQDEDNLTFVATCFQVAREDEQAAPFLEQAAGMADTGELYNRLGVVYMTMDDFERAVEAFETALDKGGLERPDQLNLNLARAYLELNRHDDGIAAAREALEDERSSETARTWITHITNEKESYEYKQRQRRDLAEFFR